MATTLSARADALIRTLELRPHPEGGHYREIHRSVKQVRPADGREPRAAITLILFLLCRDEHSRWHRVLSDELWHFHEGAPLELQQLDATGSRRQTTRLGPVEGGTLPVAVVPAGWWQAAVSTGDYTLVSCSVGPGFDFADFAMLRDQPETAERLRRSQPDLDAWL